MTLRRFRAARLAAALLVPSIALAPMLATPAHAIIVYDPTNYAQNVLQAARALQQINNQITSLQNEATMLINQARNLASLPYSSLQQLQQSLQRTQQLLGEAQRIAYNVQNIDQVFRTTYGNASMSASDQQLAVDVSSVIRASPDSFRVAWTERRYENGQLAETTRWTAILTIVVQIPRNADRLRANPLGIYVNAISWSRELGQ